MSDRVHNPALDGVRGLAIVLVLLDHGAQFFRPSPLNSPFLNAMTCGWTGVDLFFVLSGFLITGILMDTADANNRVGSFYARRALRIFPIYYLTLLGVLALRIFPAVRDWTPLHGWVDYISYFLYFQNWLPLVHSGAFPPSAIGHFWSLGVEEQFYFVWPFIVWKLRSPRKVLRISIGVAIAMLLLRLILMYTVGESIWYMTIPITRGEGLLDGAALASWIRLGKPVPRFRMAILFALAATGLSWIAVVKHSVGQWVQTIGLTLVAVLWTVVLSTAAVRNPVFSRLWSWRPLTILGRCSYGLYVYHNPIYLFSAVFIAHFFATGPPFRTPHAMIYLLFVVSASVSVALISYYFIERPCLRFKSRFEARRQPVQTVATDTTPARAFTAGQR